MLTDDHVEAWWVNHRVNSKAIGAVSDEGMARTLSTRGGRSVVRQFAHLHYVRVCQLRKRARRLAEGLEPFDGKEEPDRSTLTAALDGSAAAVDIRGTGWRGPRVWTGCRGPHVGVRGLGG